MKTNDEMLLALEISQVRLAVEHRKLTEHQLALICGYINALSWACGLGGRTFQMFIEGLELQPPRDGAFDRLHESLDTIHEGTSHDHQS